MYELAAKNPLYARVGLILLLLQLGLFLFGLPPFHFGIWVQTEPVLLVMYALAYANAAWLAAGIARQRLVPKGDTPLWWLMVAWVLWQFLATFTATTPWRSWFGPAEIGEGTAWHVSLLLMVMMMYPLLRIMRYRRIILATAFGFIVLQVVLHTLFPFDEVLDKMGGDTARWVPTKYTKDLPFMAGYLWIAYHCWWRPRNQRPQKLWSKQKFWRAAKALALIMLLWFANNRTAMLTIGLIPVMELAILAAPLHVEVRRWFAPGKGWRIVATAMCLLPLLWVVFSINIMSLKTYVDQSDVLAHTLHIHTEFSLSNKEGSIGSRVPYIQVAMRTMSHEPMRWLAGDGWGRFTDDLYKYALVDGVYSYHDGNHVANWTALNGVPSVHSHCQPIEALLSLGLVGMLLWFAIPMIVIWHVPSRHFWGIVPMLVMLTALSYFWFELAQDVPFRALALASLCRINRVSRRIKAVKKSNTIVLVLALACVVMGWTAWQQRQAILYAQRLREGLLTISADDYKPEWLLEDVKRGGDRLREMAVLYEMVIVSEVQRGFADDNSRAWYTLFLQTTHTYATSVRSNPRAASVELWLMLRLFNELSVDSMVPVKLEVFPRVPEAILLMAQKAPLRDDVAGGFLSNLPKFMPDDTAKQEGFLRQMLAVAPEHRGALWVLGNMLIKMPGREAEGRDMIHRAVALGVERVFPVTNEELSPYKQQPIDVKL